jgi:hypothetical protein
LTFAPSEPFGQTNGASAEIPFPARQNLPFVRAHGTFVHPLLYLATVSYHTAKKKSKILFPDSNLIEKNFVL